MLRRGVKRTIDLGLASTGLLIASPVLLATAFAIRSTMGAPVLFRQLRPGKDGRAFELLKFRTMECAAPGEGVESDSRRLTKLGALLRRCSVDELPTLWNVIRGDMSLVGPRPLLMEYLPRYSREQARRHQVLPGITGWAQVNGRNSISWQEKFAHDVWYVDNWSLKLDLRILVRTLFAVVRSEGISAQGHATMPPFLGNPEHPSES